MSAKLKRQILIKEILNNRSINSQEVLGKILKSEGINVTQATLSRDFAELGVVRSFTDNGVRYQVGYVRLRGGCFAVYFPSVGFSRAPLFSKQFEVGHRGSFDDEETRLNYLGVAAKVIKYALDDLSQGGG